jgi:RNA polymerase sigma-70 factor, ECF subfamily
MMGKAAIETQKRALLSRLALLHHGALFGYCRRRLGSDAEADDALQETFARALRYFHSLDQDREPRKWLFGIAHNVCIEMARARGRLTVLEAPPDVADNSHLAALERLARQESLEQLRRALQELPDRARRIIELRFFGHLSAKEIAELEGIKETAVRVALHRALEGLRGKLAAREERHEAP